MKELTLLKSELMPVREILAGFKLKGKESRYRVRVVNEIERHLAQLDAEEKQLIEDFSLKGENGEPVEIKRIIEGKEVTTYDFEDEETFLSEINVLRNETVKIDAENLKEELTVILKAIDECEDELSGFDAVAHTVLYEKIEEALV